MGTIEKLKQRSLNNQKSFFWIYTISGEGIAFFMEIFNQNALENNMGEASITGCKIIGSFIVDNGVTQGLGHPHNRGM